MLDAVDALLPPWVLFYIVPVLKLEDLAPDYEQLEFSCTCQENKAEDDVQRLWVDFQRSSWQRGGKEKTLLVFL